MSVGNPPGGRGADVTAYVPSDDRVILHAPWLWAGERGSPILTLFPDAPVALVAGAEWNVR